MNDIHSKVRVKKIVPVLFKIKPSIKYKGVGAFALKNIKKGTILCDAEKIAEEFFITHKEFKKIDTVTQKVMNDFCCQDKKGYYTPLNLNYLSIPIHMNHSCDGNVGFDKSSSFVAIKDIKNNQELCFDYALVISNPEYRLRCLCGAKNCRKIVTGNDWTDQEFIGMHFKHMSLLQRNLVNAKLRKKSEKNRSR